VPENAVHKIGLKRFYTASTLSGHTQLLQTELALAERTYRQRQTDTSIEAASYIYVSNPIVAATAVALKAPRH
jgi:hypothetical protein